MRTLKRFFISRGTVITFLGAILCAALIGGIVPQRLATSTVDLEKWVTAHPVLSPLAERLGLFRLFSTPWFALILLLALVSLTISLWDQFTVARRRTFAISDSGTEGETFAVSREQLTRVVRKAGYLPMGEHEGVLRFVRHPLGYWGNFLLHAGMVVTIVASLFVALTQQRGRITLVEGEVRYPSAPWESEELGFLAPPFIFPEAVRLDRLNLTFSPRKGIERAASDLEFLAEGGGVERRTVEVNSILRYRGVRIYQTNDYGDAFTVEFSGADGTVHREQLLMPQATGPGKPGYNDFKLRWLPYELSAKYFADAEMKSMTSGNPLLVMRLMDGGKELTRVQLRVGETGMLGNLTVRLVASGKWTGLFFVHIIGMPFIFFGFFIIIAGTVLNYSFPPRELTARTTPEGYSVQWRAARFEDFYGDEHAALVNELRKE